MYKIYIGQVPILLVSTIESSKYSSGNLRDMLVQHIPKNRKNLHRYIDNLEKGTKSFDSIIVVADDIEQLKDDFFSMYKVHKAAGGAVFNDQQQILAIHRMGYWDLPKGKQDEGESIEQTAIREVKEETGVKHLVLGDFICNTYHTYKSRKGNRILKCSTWYKMTSSDQNLTPQSEEDIDLAVWLDTDDLMNRTPIYKNILEVLHNISPKG